MSDINDSGLAPIAQETAPLRLRIIETMRTAIERGTLKPGERLVEKDLCQQMCVSRTSLREALRELEAERIIAQTSARGLTVVKISRRDAENVYSIRADVEALIVEQFIRVATPEDLRGLTQGANELIKAYKSSDFIAIVEAKRVFYRHICKVADNLVALELLSRLTLRTAQLRSKSMTRLDRQAQSIEEIESLVAAIKARDVDAARLAAKRHVEHAAASALQFAG